MKRSDGTESTAKSRELHMVKISGNMELDNARSHTCLRLTRIGGHESHREVSSEVFDPKEHSESHIKYVRNKEEMTMG